MKGLSQVRPVTGLEFYRRLAGVDQELLGARIGRTGAFISSIERGRRELDEKYRILIADALGVDPSMLDEEPSSPSPPAPSCVFGIESRVRKRRKGLGWSQGKLSARTGLSVKRVASIESGRGLATLEEALVLAEALDCEVGELFSRKERGPIKGTKSADAMAELVGKRFGNLTVISILTYEDVMKKGRYSLCRCDCGRVCNVRIDHLKSGHTTSCGCQSGKRIRRK